MKSTERTPRTESPALRSSCLAQPGNHAAHAANRKAVADQLSLTIHAPWLLPPSVLRLKLSAGLAPAPGIADRSWKAICTSKKQPGPARQASIGLSRVPSAVCAARPEDKYRYFLQMQKHDDGPVRAMDAGVYRMDFLDGRVFGTHDGVINTAAWLPSLIHCPSPRSNTYASLPVPRKLALVFPSRPSPAHFCPEHPVPPWPTLHPLDSNTHHLASSILVCFCHSRLRGQQNVVYKTQPRDSPLEWSWRETHPPTSSRPP
jgi:hypothetical protein